MDRDDERASLLTGQDSRARSSGTRCKGIVVTCLVLLLLVAGVTVALVLTWGDGPKSTVRTYSKGVVLADYEGCSKIGSDMMHKNNGSAVDAAIATVLCIGVTGAQASGIGGNHFMVIHDTPKDGGEKQTITISSRGKAPSAATKEMFQNVSSVRGGLSITVMGELYGLHEAWTRFGRLPWKQLVQPTVKLCQEGFKVPEVLARRIKSTLSYLTQDAPLRKVLTKPDGSGYKVGDIMKRPLLAKTLQYIAEDGPLSFYSGKMAADVLSDIRDAGGIITEKDITNYASKVQSPLHTSLANGTLDLYVPQLPSGGPVMQYMLRLLDGFHFEGMSLEDLRASPDFHQALAETFKFGFAMRSYLGDPDQLNMTKPMYNMTSTAFIDHIRSKIDLKHTHNWTYYGSVYIPKPDHGTAHVSVLSPDGGAVAVTTSINAYFGSYVYGTRTGIIFNDDMNDFSSLNFDDFWGLKPSPANFIAANKRPQSSMSPCIVLDRKTKQPVFVNGGAGGTKIVTQVTLTTYMNVVLGIDVGDVIDFPRIHHQLLPPVLDYEKGVDPSVLDSLRQKGHKLSVTDELAIIYSIRETCNTTVNTTVCLKAAVGDRRRESQPWGWN